MKASEAMRFADVVAKHLDHDDNSEAMAFIDAARAALREKAEREEQERPKVTLAEQASAALLMARDAWSGLIPRLRPTSDADLAVTQQLYAAAATLRKLDEEGGKLLAELDRMIAAKRTIECVTWRPTADFLRSLGVEPKP